MEVCFFSHNISFSLRNKSAVREWIVDCIISERKFPGNISFVFTNDRFLSGLNKKYLSHHWLTDIITFDYNAPGIIQNRGRSVKNVKNYQEIFGDVCISIDRVKENAGIYHSTFYGELYRVMIHGILHLCGYPDKTLLEKKKMIRKENYYLHRLNGK